MFGGKLFSKGVDLLWYFVKGQITDRLRTLQGASFIYDIPDDGISLEASEKKIRIRELELKPEALNDLLFAKSSSEPLSQPKNISIRKCLAENIHWSIPWQLEIGVLHITVKLFEGIEALDEKLGSNEKLDLNEEEEKHTAPESQFSFWPSAFLKKEIITHHNQMKATQSVGK